jgi:hypothetical protein
MNFEFIENKKYAGYNCTKEKPVTLQELNNTFEKLMKKKNELEKLQNRVKIDN